MTHQKIINGVSEINFSFKSYQTIHHMVDLYLFRSLGRIILYTKWFVKKRKTLLVLYPSLYNFYISFFFFSFNLTQYALESIGDIKIVI